MIEVPVFVVAIMLVKNVNSHVCGGNNALTSVCDVIYWQCSHFLCCVDVNIRVFVGDVNIRVFDGDVSICVC